MVHDSASVCSALFVLTHSETNVRLHKTVEAWEQVLWSGEAKYDCECTQVLETKKGKDSSLGFNSAVGMKSSTHKQLLLDTYWDQLFLGEHCLWPEIIATMGLRQLYKVEMTKPVYSGDQWKFSFRAPIEADRTKSLRIALHKRCSHIT